MFYSISAAPHLRGLVSNIHFLRLFLTAMKGSLPICTIDLSQAPLCSQWEL